MNSHKATHLQSEVIRIKAPARTCLFGDHQDYLHLPVIACAIDRHITLTANPVSQKHIEIHMPDIGEVKKIALDENFSNGVTGDHLMAAFKVFQKHGGTLPVAYTVILKGNVAINAGISSSSAVVVAWITFLLTASATPMRTDREFIAQLAYEAEVTEQNSPGGRMDQYTIALGNIIYLETDDNAAYEIFTKDIPGLIVGESGVPKPTLSLLGDLRSKAWEAIRTVQKTHPDFDIATATNADLKTLLPLVPEPLQKIFEAAVRNHAITQSALEEIRKAHLDMPRIGHLINAHHEVLKVLLGITVPLIDDMIDAAIQAGALGAKIVGSGLGGSIIALAPEGKEQQVVEAIKMAGAKDAYQVKTDPGVQIITPNYNL